MFFFFFLTTAVRNRLLSLFHCHPLLLWSLCFEALRKKIAACWDHSIKANWMKNSGLLHAACTIIYLETEICGIYLGECPFSLFWRRAFCLIHENSTASHLINPWEEPELCVWCSDGWTHSGPWISQLLLLQPSQLLHLLFTKLKWSVKEKKKSQFSLVSRQLFLIFWMDYASFIFCNRF